MNSQKISKNDQQRSGFLTVKSIFHTIQGEGPFSGLPAVFVRLVGCNLCCPSCDTNYSADTETVIYSPDVLAANIRNLLRKHPETRLIVITGGEPFRQNITPLCKMLLDKGPTEPRIQVETNGTLPPPNELPHKVHVVCSPKTASVNERVATRADHWKYVLSAGFISDEDGLPTKALGHPCATKVARPPSNYRKPVFVQPEQLMIDPKCEDIFACAANLAATVQSSLKHGHVLQIQLHKHIGLE